MALKFSDLMERISGKLNDVDDAVQGGSAGGSPYGSGGNPYPLYGGLLGVEFELDNVEAARLSNSTTTLYGGIYKYVQFITPSTASPAVGIPVFYQSANLQSQTGSQYIVSPDNLGATSEQLLAGVAIKANTKGNYGFIQVLGEATLLAKATPTTTVAGSLAVVTTTASTFDAIADATAVTAGGTVGLKHAVGYWLDAPGTATVAALKKAIIKFRTYFG